MTLKLDRLQRATSLVDGSGLPTSQFQWFWQKTMEAIERSINDLIDILSRLGIVEAVAEDIRVDLEETRAAPVILSEPSAKFASGYVLTSTPTISFTLGAGIMEAVFSGSTDDVPEGANLYFTDTRARSALSGGSGISYNSGTGQIAVSAKLAAYDGGDAPSAFTLSIVDSASAGAWLTAIGAAPTTRSISTGAGLVGGGNLTADRTLSLATSGVTAGSYGSATKVPTITLDAYGRATIASENTIPALASGTYTPTATIVGNLDSVTPQACQYQRVGNTVVVSGAITVDPTAAGSTASLRVTTPVPTSNFTADNQAGGTGAIGGVQQSAAFNAVVGAQEVGMTFMVTDTSSRTVRFIFMYQVI